MVTVVLPAYNEADNLAPLIETIARLGYQTVVVDDGSTDDTAKVAEEAVSRFAGVHLMRHDGNRGLGVAVRTGLKAAVDMGSDRIVVMDSDGSHDPSLIGEMLKHREDVVIASRFVPGGQVVGVPLHRQIISIAASVIMRQMMPMPGVRDYSCGYRCYSANVLRRASASYGWDNIIAHPGFECMVELLGKLSRLGATVTEVPLVLRYDRKIGQSKMRIARTVRGYWNLKKESGTWVSA